MATSKEHLPGDTSQLVPSPAIFHENQQSIHQIQQPIISQLSREHLMPADYPFYLTDLINFDLNYLNNYWHLISKSYIS